MAFRPAEPTWAVAQRRTGADNYFERSGARGAARKHRRGEHGGENSWKRWLQRDGAAHRSSPKSKERLVGRAKETLLLPSRCAKRKGRARSTKNAARPARTPASLTRWRRATGISQSVPAIRRGRRAHASDGQCAPQRCRSALFKRADFGWPKGREGVWHRPPICIERPRTTRGIACRGATAEA